MKAKLLEAAERLSQLEKDIDKDNYSWTSKYTTQALFNILRLILTYLLYKENSIDAIGKPLA